MPKVGSAIPATRRSRHGGRTSDVGNAKAGGLILLLVLMMAGCSKDARPPIADSTMVNLLIEFHLADGRIETMDGAPPGLADSILRAYDVDSTTYHDAAAWYARHPDSYSDLYSRVLDKLTAERMEFGNTGASAYLDTVSSASPASSPPSP